MENNNDFIKDWMEGKISPEELRIRKEKGDEVVTAFDDLITRSSKLKVPDTISQEDAWKKFALRVSETPVQKDAKVVRMNLWLPLGIAASLTLIVVALFLFSKTEISTQLAETKVHVLPDGSEVTLNADSKISFRKIGWSGNRVVALEGEAFFNVKKGSLFMVENEKGTVTVLGTSFNVNTRSNEFSVACYTGKVNVSSSGKNVILTKGLATKLSNNTLTEAESFDDQQGTWRSGDFYFEDQTLEDVFDELERQFSIEITFSGDATRTYNGYFSNTDLEKALDMVLLPMGLTYNRENNKIIVK